MGLNQSRPHCGQTRGALGGGTQRGASSRFQVQRLFITSRSWPLSTPVESTAFDSLLVLLYLPGVTRLDWHMLKAVSFDNLAVERGGCRAHAHQTTMQPLCLSTAWTQQDAPFLWLIVSFSVSAAIDALPLHVSLRGLTNSDETRRRHPLFFVRV